MDERVARERLGRRLADLVPGVGLCLTPLPGGSPLRLWLIDDPREDQRLDDNAVHALTEAPPYWSFCWASGQVLARHLLARPELVRGRRVLDVGAGSGVVGIAAALAGAREVISCDSDPVAREAIALNASANGVPLQLADRLEEWLERVDVILAADILYDRDNAGLPERFRVAPGVLLADSRIRDLDPPGYRLVRTDQAVTWPDLGEAREYNRVRLFAAGLADMEP